jgi:histidinol-phosphate phosphatase family protein
MRPAAFLDRDGTLIEDAHYLADPAWVRLIPGATDAVRRLVEAGIAPVIVTNQSGIALGYLNEHRYQQIRRQVERAFRDAGAPILATYHCPHHPDVNGPCECRKPGTGMYRKAIAAHDLDGARALFAGDRRRDVEPATSFGGCGILVPSVDTPEADITWARAEAMVASSLDDAVTLFLAWLDRAAEGGVT